MKTLRDPCLTETPGTNQNTSDVNWDDLNPPCAMRTYGCERPAEFIVKWDNCRCSPAYGKAHAFNCEPCSKEARRCPYCGIRGFETIVGRL